MVNGGGNYDAAAAGTMFYSPSPDQIPIDQAGYLPMPATMDGGCGANSTGAEKQSNNRTMVVIMVVSGIFVAYAIYYLKSKKNITASTLISKYLPSEAGGGSSSKCMLCASTDDSAAALNLCKKHSRPSDKKKMMLIKSVERERDLAPRPPVTYPLGQLDLYPHYRLKLRSAIEAQNLDHGIMSTENMVNSLIVARPVFDSVGALSDNNFFGVFEVSDEYSAVLNITETTGENTYNEIVVYSYPDWKVAYANTKVDEVFFDTLKPGKYCLALFSVEKLKSVITLPIENLGKPLPLHRPHRKTSGTNHDSREASIESVVLTTANEPISEALNVKSTPIFVWPGAVYTRVENINTVVSPNIKKLLLTVPSFGFISEGYAQHIGAGNKVHEGDNTSVYKVVTDDKNMVNITVVYPNIDPESEVVISPSLTLYGFED